MAREGYVDKTDRERNADIGTGTIDWKAIFAKAKQSGLKHYYIEQESYPGEPIDKYCCRCEIPQEFLAIVFFVYN